MRRFLRISILILCPAIPVVAAELAAPSPVAPELRRMTQELLDAVAPGEASVWLRYLDDRFVHLDENGVVRDKAVFLRELKPLPSGLEGRIEIDRFEATIAGDTAVAAYEVQEYLDYHGQPLHTRFRALDTWIATPAGWRLVGEHITAVLKDPPAVPLSPQELRGYAGIYSLTATIKTTIRSDGDGLASERQDRPPTKYSAELRDLFFSPGQPRSRRIFTRNAEGRIDGFLDRREGEDVRWTKDGDERGAVEGSTRARGSFEVKVHPVAQEEFADGGSLGRWSLDKQVHGDLEATSKGEMFAAGTAVKGSAGYVAIERVDGTLNGRRGTFMLQHLGSMAGGTQHMTIAVVPDSGTGELAGLAGNFEVLMVGEQHTYEFDYTLAP